MCITCTIEEVTGLDLSTDEGHDALQELGRIPWPEVTDEMREAAAFIAALYVRLAPTGGPLHVVTDDFNVEDSNLAFCRKETLGLQGLGGPEEIVATLGIWILDLLDALDEKQRSVTIALAHGELAEIHGKVYMPSTEFPIREQITDAEGLVIGTRWGFRQRTVGAGR